MVQAWNKPSMLLNAELEQARDEGKDVSDIQKSIAELNANNTLKSFEREQLAIHLFETIRKIKPINSYPYDEPNELQHILPRHCHTKTNKNQTLSYDEHFNRIYGGLLGKCTGCLLGKPIEGWRRKEIHNFLNSTANMPLKKFLHEGLTESQLKQYHLLGTLGKKFIPGEYDGKMPEDDDTNYLLTAHHIIQQHGTTFTPQDAAYTWLDTLPINRLYTAERMAYRNLAQGIKPPLSAYFCNPYREWIGALIRADYFGYISPGNPIQAATMAWTDASISHVKNGIYGAMWVASILALLPAHTLDAKLIYLSLEFTPKKSRFYQAISHVLKRYKAKLPYQCMIDDIHTQYNERKIHHWCHIIPNAMIIAGILLWHASDFSLALTETLKCGFDTDSNAATVGSILGYHLGAKRIPHYWKNYFNDTIDTAVLGSSKVSIIELARQATTTASIKSTGALYHNLRA
ncbi:MAG: ADP-ribosylglycohydrolase family protein [Coxiellaceae bacterium]|nr:ADP-ribosylglycohydrolase family protein [Coxiellaceae bacterium]